MGIAPATCVEWVREAFLMKKNCALPPKISIHPQGTDFINTMPCLLPERFHRFGCKVVSRIKGSFPSLKSDMMLIDSATGNLIALINCDWITAMRTGAVAALAIDTLQNSTAKIYAFVGLGVIGHAVIDCLLAINQDKEIIIRLKKYKDHAVTTAAQFSNYKNVKFEFADTMEALVDGADVVVSCITDADGILVEDVNLFKPGVLVVPVHTRGFQNCDTVFDKVFADDEGHVKGFKYFNQFRKFGEIGDVLSGRIVGRESDEERILSYNIGLGLHDVLYAQKIEDIILPLANTPPQKKNL
ncbi:MAG: ornithine cyclodeaminase [Muribaculum sp.]|nr:ornithine cyclodeaminase [Muribaculum sp.]